MKELLSTKRLLFASDTLRGVRLAFFSIHGKQKKKRCKIIIIHIKKNLIVGQWNTFPRASRASKKNKKF